MGYFRLIAIGISNLHIPVAYLLREVDQGDEVDSWHNIWTLEPGNEKTAAGSNFKHKS